MAKKNVALLNGLIKPVMILSQSSHQFVIKVNWGVRDARYGLFALGFLEYLVISIQRLATKYSLFELSGFKTNIRITTFLSTIYHRSLSFLREQEPMFLN